MPSTAAAKLDDSIARATDAMLARQQADGHWVFELEADCTIPSQYVLAHHFIGTPLPAALEQKMGAYLRRIQGAHGGWPLFHEGDMDVSASVTAYLALKAIGDRPDAEHMRRAREAILARGGAAASNVFTRFLLALFGVVTWRCVPVMPVEIILLPQWFPFHLSKISYWSRTTILPMLVLQALKARARNPKGVSVDELFIDPPLTLGPPHKAAHQKTSWFMLFRAIDILLRAVVPLFPKRLRQRAIDRVVAFLTSHLNGEEGIGSIFPPMVYAVMMCDALGYERDHPFYVTARDALDRLVVERADEAYCQPCKSPVWDTGLVCQALLEVGSEKAVAETVRGAGMAQAAPDSRSERRLGRLAAELAPRRLGLPIPQCLLPGRGRHRRRGHGHGSRRQTSERPAIPRGDRARARMDPRHAKQKWRLGRFRRRQQLPIS